MDLLEYQAKILFREVGIPVLPSQQIYQPRELKQLQIPYPIVLKSQVHGGGRSRAGGVRFVENTIDAIAVAQTLLRLPIGGECPELLLAEARYDIAAEYYLAVALDYRLQYPVLLGSVEGGDRTDTALEQVQVVVVDGCFSPHYARRLAIQMGLRGERIQTISRIVEKMYRLFAYKDLDSVEINPLAVNANGKVMALDGKITLSNAAILRHPELKLVVDIAPNQPRESRQWQNPEGQIQLVCPDSGTAALLWDSLTAAHCLPQACRVLPMMTEADGERLQYWLATRHAPFTHWLLVLPADIEAAMTLVELLATTPAAELPAQLTLCTLVPVAAPLATLIQESTLPWARSLPELLTMLTETTATLPPVSPLSNLKPVGA